MKSLRLTEVAVMEIQEATFCKFKHTAFLNWANWMASNTGIIRARHALLSHCGRSELRDESNVRDVRDVTSALEATD